MSDVKIKSLVDGIANAPAGTIVTYPEKFAKRLVDRGDAEYVVDEKKTETKAEEKEMPKTATKKTTKSKK